MKIKSLWLFLFCGIILGSCLKKEDFDFSKLSKTTWNPEVAMPLMYSNLQAVNVIAKADPSVMRVDKENLVTLVYPGKTITVTGGEMFQLEDFTIPVGPLSTGPQVELKFPLLNTDGKKLKKIVLSSGYFKFNLTKGSATGTINVTLKSISGEPSATIDLNGNIPDSIPIGGKTITLNDQGEFTFGIDLTNLGGNVENVEFSFVKMDYTSIEGDFGNTMFTLPKDSIQINLFKNVSERGDFEVNDPRLFLDVKNGMGIPFDLLLNKSFGYLTNGDSIPFEKKAAPIPIAGKTSPTSGTVRTKVKLDKSNTEIKNFIRPTPSWIVMQPLMQSNPTPLSPGQYNFLEKSATCEISTSMEMPLHGKVISFVVLDTVPVGLKDALDVIQDFSIKSKVVNGFPMDAIIDVTLLDINYQPLLKGGEPVRIIKDQILCSSGLVSGEVVVGTTTTNQDYIIDKSEIPFLKEAEFAQIRAVMKTDQGSNAVKILSTYSMEVSMGIKLKGNIKLTE
ncbi:MAG: hypothetical protein KDC83_02055 [Flavobacteriales bacterium]|nr:hypothetical protein [Flavobacteriales bacterium]